MSAGEARHGLFLTHRAALVDYAAPILGSREEAEDIVQDAFLRFGRAAPLVDTPERALAYLYRIVRNLAFDVLKRRKIERREREAGVPFWALPQTAEDPEQALLLCDQVRVVSEVLSGLSVDVRVAVEMHRFGGFTLEEVADHLGISVATAHRHVRAALLAVARRLDRA